MKGRLYHFYVTPEKVFVLWWEQPVFLWIKSKLFWKTSCKMRESSIQYNVEKYRVTTSQGRTLCCITVPEITDRR